MYTLSTDESISMAKKKSVSRPEKFDTCYPKRLTSRGSCRGGSSEEKSNTMRRIQLDNL